MKAQVSMVVLAIVIILISGFLISAFMPVLEDVRLDLINDMDNYESTNSLLRIIIYGLKPLIWIGYIFLSLVALVVITNQASQNPL